MNKKHKYPLFFVILLCAMAPVFVCAVDDYHEVEKTVEDYFSTNDRQGMISYLKSQEKMNNPAGLFYMGYLYISGFVTRDAKLANAYFMKAIKMADKDLHTKSVAHKALADSYYSGDGCEKSLSLAHEHYLTSAQLGYAPGMFNVAITFKEFGHMKEHDYWMKQYKETVEECD